MVLKGFIKARTERLMVKQGKALLQLFTVSCDISLMCYISARSMLQWSITKSPMNCGKLGRRRSSTISEGNHRKAGNTECRGINSWRRTPWRRGQYVTVLRQTCLCATVQRELTQGRLLKGGEPRSEIRKKCELWG